MSQHHADAGRPMQDEVTADAKIRYHRFPVTTRQISLRNTWSNTLWISFNRRRWFDIACGTSWDDRVAVNGFWFRTQTGETTFVVNGIQLARDDSEFPAPTEEELSSE